MTGLDDSNFLLYAAANYQNYQCYDTNEFNDDLSRFKYLKRLFYRYYERQELKERLILNHLTIIFNVFEHRAAIRMLFFKIDRCYWGYLKTFLVFLNYMPTIVENVEGENIRSSDILLDEKIIETLRKL
jgi:hypothetical protein